MRNVALLVFGYLALVLQTGLASRVEVYPFSPNLLLPVVLYLGVASDVHIVRGAALSFVLGYLVDSFCGSPMGLHTFVFVATFMVARGARLRVLVRGFFFQAGANFVATILAGMLILMLRAIFAKPRPFPAETLGGTALVVIAPAVTTAVLGPFLFDAVRWIDALAVRKAKGEEAMA